MSRSLRFATVLASSLREPRVTSIEGKCYRVTGRFDTGVLYVSVDILIPWLFKNLKRSPPVVRCQEPWMKSQLAWHNWRSIGMCWVLPDLWRDVMNWKGKRVRAIIDEGIAWLRNDVGSLVNRHYYAHLQGLDTWSADWDAWDHGKKGITEYRREKRERLLLPRGQTASSLRSMLL